MKKLVLLYFILISSSIIAQVQDNVTWSTSPDPFNDSEKIKISVSGVDPSKWSTEDVYLWTWFFDSNDVEVSSHEKISWSSSSISKIHHMYFLQSLIMLVPLLLVLLKCMELLHFL